MDSMPVKTLIVYMSVEHGNTEKVAKAMAEATGADLRKADEVDPTIIPAYDLIGFGSGIFKGKFHARLLKVIEEMPSSDKKAFVFSTGGYGYVRFNRPVKDLLRAKGMTVVGDFACKGWDTYGLLGLMGGLNKARPNEEDLENARRFARSLLLA
jgi:flavodoxin